MHSIRKLKFKRPSRRNLPGLSTLKTPLEIISKAGSAMPPLQAAADAALEVIKCVEVRTPLQESSCFTEASLTYEHDYVIRQTIQKNRKESTELAEHAEEIAKAVIDVPLPSGSTQVDKQYEEHVLALQRCVIGRLSFVAVPRLNDNDTHEVNSSPFLGGWRS